MDITLPKIYQVSDIIQWSEKGELELSPKYQRDKVWNETAKAYLIDSIIRGLPIPPIFLRQTLNIDTKTTSKEVIDGQQRIRTIIEYVVEEKFSIKKSHNKEYGGKYYSDLNDEDKENILNYQLLAEVVTEKEDSVIYDMFARLNSNNYVLNSQEIRNAMFWGEFKVLVYRIASKYRDFFLDYGILTDKDCTRMKDAELINSMIILFVDGIVTETKTSVNKIYEKYDKSFEEASNVEKNIDFIMSIIEKIYKDNQERLLCFSNRSYFFTLYATLTNQMFGIINAPDLFRNPRFEKKNINKNANSLRTAIKTFISDYDIAVNTNKANMDSNWSAFVRNHSLRTTSKEERLERIAFLNKYFG